MKKAFLILGLGLIALVLFAFPIFKFLAPFFPKQQPSIPTTIPEEERCQNDADCGVNICECRALNKNYLASKDKICARVCPGEPVCYKNRCIFKGEKDKRRLQIEPTSVISGQLKQCDLPNTEGVYSCVGGDLKVVSKLPGGGFTLIDRQGKEIIRCGVVAPQYVDEKCKNLSCSSENLCQ